MRKVKFFLLIIPLVILTAGCKNIEDKEETFNFKEKLAMCLTEKGWVMYGTAHCSACIAQKKAFGEAWKYINYIECDPDENNSNPDLCLKRNIKYTPTWILEVDGKEVRRLETYLLLEDLSNQTDCVI